MIDNTNCGTFPATGMPCPWAVQQCLKGRELTEQTESMVAETPIARTYHRERKQINFLLMLCVLHKIFEKYFQSHRLNYNEYLKNS
jgi:hypothetical protein